MMILAGDIGGTHARLAIFDSKNGQLDLIQQQVFRSREHVNLREVVQTFLAGRAVQIEGACFGVAGPVIEERVVTSNLPWVVQRRALQATLKISSVWLLNDLEAATFGIDALKSEDLYELNEGKLGPGNRAVLFAGTGLGEGLAIWHEGHHIPSPSEGGHSDFCPRSSLEMELHDFISKKFGHVSWERVLSGPGILNLYQFFHSKDPFEEEEWFAKEVLGNHPSIAILRAAEAGESVNCQRARDLFIRLLGRESGNLALKGLATGGVYLGGGIAANMANLLNGAKFLDEFRDKGRMQGVLSAIPVRVIVSDDVGLLGAARFAAERLSSQRKAA